MNDFQYPAGATPLEPEEMGNLKIGHITTREELNRFEQDNILVATITQVIREEVYNRDVVS